MEPQKKRERRRFFRIPFQAVLQCKPHRKSDKSKTKMTEASEALTKNISQSGILINSIKKLNIGQYLDLKITIPSMEGYSSVNIAGKVVWVRRLNSKSYDCGIEFTLIKATDADVIGDFIQFFPAEEEEIEIESEMLSKTK